MHVELSLLFRFFFLTVDLRMPNICLSATSPFSVPAPSQSNTGGWCVLRVSCFSSQFVQLCQKFSTCVPALFHWLVKGSSVFPSKSLVFLHSSFLDYGCFIPPFWGTLCQLCRSIYSAIQVFHRYLGHLYVHLTQCAKHL